MQMYSVTFEGTGLTDDRRSVLWRSKWIVESYEPDSASPVAEVRGQAADEAEAVAKVKAALGDAADEFSNFGAERIYIQGDRL